MSVPEKVLTIITEQLTPRPHHNTVKPADNLREDLGADSLDEVEMIMELESTFGIEITDDQAETVKTVKDAVELVDNLVNGSA